MNKRNIIPGFSVLVMEAIVYGYDQGAEKGGVVGINDIQFITVPEGKPFFVDLSHRDAFIVNDKIHAEQAAFYGVVSVLALYCKAWSEQGKLLFYNGAIVIPAKNMVFGQEPEQPALNIIQFLPGYVVYVYFGPYCEYLPLNGKHRPLVFIEHIIPVAKGKNLLFDIQLHLLPP